MGGTYPRGDERFQYINNKIDYIVYIMVDDLYCVSDGFAVTLELI